MQDRGGEKVWRCVLRNDAEEHVQSCKEVESGWGWYAVKVSESSCQVRSIKKGIMLFQERWKCLFLPKVSCLCEQLLPANMRLVYTEMFSDLFYSYTLKHTWSLHEETDFKNEMQRKHYSNNNKHWFVYLHWQEAAVHKTLTFSRNKQMCCQFIISAYEISLPLKKHFLFPSHYLSSF